MQRYSTISEVQCASVSQCVMLRANNDEHIFLLYHRDAQLEMYSVVCWPRKHTNMMFIRELLLHTMHGTLPLTQLQYIGDKGR